MEYENFKNIINDKSHLEYKDTKLWGEGQGYVNYDLEVTNLYLKENF